MKRSTQFAPLILLFALVPALMLMGYSCDRGDTYLLSLEFEVYGADHLEGFNVNNRDYSLFNSSATAVIRTEARQPDSNVTYQFLINGVSDSVGDIGLGGGEATLDIPSGASLLIIAVRASTGVVGYYRIDINPPCTPGVCDDGTSCSMDLCDTQTSTCDFMFLVEGDICDYSEAGADGLCIAGSICEEACGNGNVDAVLSEACDQGVDNGSGEGFCVGDCSGVQTCGDSVANGTEVCDDGVNTGGEGGCVACAAVQTCGDASVDGTEVCEVGDTVDCTALGTSFASGTAACTASCDDWDTSACVPAVFNPDFVLCGSGNCDRHGAQTGALVERFITGGLTSRFRAFSRSGETWHVERLPFGAHFRVYRYLFDGTALGTAQHDFTAEAPTLASTGNGNVYWAGADGYIYPIGAIYGFDATAANFQTVVPDSTAECGDYQYIFPVPPDPLDPTREEVIAMGQSSTGPEIWRVDLNDTDGDGVHCTETLLDLSTYLPGTLPGWILNIRQAPDGMVFALAGDPSVPNAGLHRISGGESVLLRANTSVDEIHDFAIGPEDGLIYALVGAFVGNTFRILTLDPETGAELGTMPGYVSDPSLGSDPTIDFLPGTCTESPSVNVDCSQAACGDGILNASAGELCDDGNLINGDGCEDDCEYVDCDITEATCLAGESCYPTAQGDFCLPTGSGAVDDVCPDVNDCDTGLGCVQVPTDSSGTAYCRPLCDLGQGIACADGSPCVDLLGDSNMSACLYDLCDLYLQDCPAGAGCYPNGPDRVCWEAGTEGQDASCTDFRDCAAGLTCVDVSGPGTGLCLEICDLSDPVCPAGYGCASVGGGAYGVCFAP